MYSTKRFLPKLKSLKMVKEIFCSKGNGGKKTNYPQHKKYVLEEEINSGAFGIVYSAYIRSPDKNGETVQVAVKIVEILDTDDKNNAIYEASIQRDLRSIPNVVHLIDFFFHDDKAFFVQELAVGGDVLDRLLEKKRYTEREARKLAKSLLSAVRDLHFRGIVHRDLKPENLLLKTKEDDTNIMLCDFGDAFKIFPDDDEEGKLLTICGTPAFMAPEIVTEVGYREEVDMWSIGCILYLLIGGYAPFGYDKDKAYERASNSDYHFDCRPWTTEVSSSAMELISGLLTVDPDDRSTASEALNSRWFAPKITKRSSRRVLSSPLDLSKLSAAICDEKLNKQRSQRNLFQQRKHPSIVSHANNRQRV